MLQAGQGLDEEVVVRLAVGVLQDADRGYWCLVGDSDIAGGYSELLVLITITRRARNGRAWLVLNLDFFPGLIEWGARGAPRRKQERRREAAEGVPRSRKSRYDQQGGKPSPVY